MKVVIDGILGDNFNPLIGYFYVNNPCWTCCWKPIFVNFTDIKIYISNIYLLCNPNQYMYNLSVNHDNYRAFLINHQYIDIPTLVRNYNDFENIENSIKWRPYIKKNVTIDLDYNSTIIFPKWDHKYTGLEKITYVNDSSLMGWL